MAIAEDCPERPPIRRQMLAAILLIVVFLGGAAVWSAVAPLASAAIAFGSVNLESYRKTVQHLEGGIIAGILVNEGDAVEAGQVLIRLDETQARARIELLDAQINSEVEQLGYLAEEIVGIEKLVGQGYSPKTRLLDLYRRRSELQGLKTEQEAQLEAARDVIARSVIRAPIAGIVVGLRVHTTGGVIRPGDPLLSLVPLDEPLVVEVRVNPNDIDIVHKDLVARVRLTPLNARSVPPLEGRVVWISADAMTDEKSGASYYLARVEITARDGLPEDVVLYPGMPAEVMIPTGERTFFDYLMAPITRSFRHAFREQ
jgi:multidrug efflux pump subunit AcrA (membrane-fusion protein)